MAGTLVIDTLKASSGVLATQNGMTGIAKAWVNYNAITQTIANSFNVSSVTYNSTGNFSVNFSTAMPNANYATVVGKSNIPATHVLPGMNVYNNSTSQVLIQIYDGGGTFQNSSINSVVVIA